MFLVNKRKSRIVTVNIAPKSTSACPHTTSCILRAACPHTTSCILRAACPHTTSCVPAHYELHTTSCILRADHYIMQEITTGRLPGWCGVVEYQITGLNYLNNLNNLDSINSLILKCGDLLNIIPSIYYVTSPLFHRQL